MDGRVDWHFMLRKTLICLLFFIVFHISAIPDCQASADQIEQVYINKPDISVYYRCDALEEEPEAYLGGERLSLTDNRLFSETGEEIENYFLLDISGSIKKERFSDIKESLIQFLSELRNDDKLILLTFGDDVTVLLDGSESREEAESRIRVLEAKDHNTLLFDAMNEATEMMTAAGNESRKRRVMTVISDGKDCADNTRSAETVEKRLISRGIPVYTIAVENNEGDSAVTVQEYRSKFSALATNTGGIPWTIDQGNSVLDGLHMQREAVLGSWRGEFRSKTNRVSNQNEDFVLKFPDGTEESVSVLVSRSRPDEIAPEIDFIAPQFPDSLKISYTEAVENALDSSNYYVKCESKTFPVQQVLSVEDSETDVRLIFAQDLENGSYELQIHNVCDCSNEKNPLTNTQYTFEVTGIEKESGEVLSQIYHWLPLILAGILLLLLLLLLLFWRKIKKNKVVVVDGMVVKRENIEKKVHVEVKSPEEPSKKVVLWLKNGSSVPKPLEYEIKGSVMVGRSSKNCDIFCDDPTMGRQHFSIIVEKEGNVWIMDLKSRNGTFVNGKQIRMPTQLWPGDEIRAGRIIFRIEW